jgi:DNA-binding CsgD family transcriptional regulator
MKASDKAAAELSALAGLPDSDIDTSDIPENADWTDAVRGRFHRGDAPSRPAVSLKRMSNEQKAEIRTLLLQGMSRYDIAEQLGVTPGQVSAVRAWITMRNPAMVLPTPADSESDEIVEAVETTFGLERDLQAALRRNIAQLEPGLTIVDGDRERRVESGGRIDILAKDRSGGMVVIELKAGRADRDAVGQILAYMGELMDEAASVRGILVAAEFSPRSIAAARAAPTIRLIRYGIQFSFNAIGARVI